MHQYLIFAVSICLQKVFYKNTNHDCCTHRICDIPVPNADSIVIGRESDDIMLSFSDRIYGCDVSFSLYVNYAVLIVS